MLLWISGACLTGRICKTLPRKGAEAQTFVAILCATTTLLSLWLGTLNENALPGAWGFCTLIGALFGLIPALAGLLTAIIYGVIVPPLSSGDFLCAGCALILSILFRRYQEEKKSLPSPKDIAVYAALTPLPLLLLNTPWDRGFWLQLLLLHPAALYLTGRQLLHQLRLYDRIKYLRNHEEELILRESLYRTTLKSFPQAVLRLDPAGRVLDWNPGATGLFGWLPEEVMGQIPPFVPEDQLEQFQELMARALRGEVLREIQLTRKNRLGQQMNVALNSARVLDASGRPDCVISSIRDITEELRAKEERKAQNAALEQSLLESRGLLQEVHHRVKNNLQVVASLLSLEFRRSGNEAWRSKLQNLQGRIHAMALLHESVYREGDYSEVALDKYLKEVLQSQVHSWRDMDFDLHVDYDLSPLRLGIDDAIPCGLILTEWLANCFKHSFETHSKGQLSLVLHRQGEEIRMELSDSGVGMDADPSHRGTGLRLVERLTQQLHGRQEYQKGPPNSSILYFPSL